MQFGSRAVLRRKGIIPHPLDQHPASSALQSYDGNPLSIIKLHHGKTGVPELDILAHTTTAEVLLRHLRRPGDASRLTKVRLGCQACSLEKKRVSHPPAAHSPYTCDTLVGLADHVKFKGLSDSPLGYSPDVLLFLEQTTGRFLALPAPTLETKNLLPVFKSFENLFPSDKTWIWKLDDAFDTPHLTDHLSTQPVAKRHESIGAIEGLAGRLQSLMRRFVRSNLVSVDSESAFGKALQYLNRVGQYVVDKYQHFPAYVMMADAHRMSRLEELEKDRLARAKRNPPPHSYRVGDLVWRYQENAFKGKRGGWVGPYVVAVVGEHQRLVLYPVSDEGSLERRRRTGWVHAADLQPWAPGKAFNAVIPALPAVSGDATPAKPGAPCVLDTSVGVFRKPVVVSPGPIPSTGMSSSHAPSSSGSSASVPNPWLSPLAPASLPSDIPDPWANSPGTPPPVASDPPPTWSHMPRILLQRLFFGGPHDEEPADEVPRSPEHTPPPSRQSRRSSLDSPSGYREFPSLDTDAGHHDTDEDDNLALTPPPFDSGSGSSPVHKSLPAPVAPKSSVFYSPLPSPTDPTPTLHISPAKPAMPALPVPAVPKKPRAKRRTEFEKLLHSEVYHLPTLEEVAHPASDEPDHALIKSVEAHKLAKSVARLLPNCGRAYDYSMVETLVDLDLLDDATMKTIFCKAAVVGKKDALGPAWDAARADELNMFEKCGVLAPGGSITPPSGVEIQNSSWVLTKKDNGKERARCVSGGSKQALPKRFTQSSTPNPRAVKTVLSLYSTWDMCTFDVPKAFLQAEPVTDGPWLKVPPEWVAMGSMPYRRCAKYPYGDQRAPKQWHASLLKFLVGQGWTLVSEDECILRLRDDAILMMHVDDGLLLSKTASTREAVIKTMTAKYGVDTCINLSPNSSITWAGTVLSRVGSDLLLSCDLAKMPATAQQCNLRLKQGQPVTEDILDWYLVSLGKLNYFAGLNFFEYSIISSELPRNPDMDSALALDKEIRRFQYGVHTGSLRFKPVDVTRPLHLLVITDAALIHKDESTARSGMLWMLCQDNHLSLVGWKSSKMHRVVTSSLGAELYAAEQGLDIALELGWFIEKLVAVKPTITWLCDNLGAVETVFGVNLVKLHGYTRLTAMKLKELHSRKEFRVCHVGARLMLADILTKATTSIKMTALIQQVRDGSCPLPWRRAMQIAV